MPANLENSAVATGLEKVSFHSNPKERQCQRMLKLPRNCTHLKHYKVVLKILQARLQQDVNREQGEECSKGKHQIGYMFSAESKENRCQV